MGIFKKLFSANTASDNEGTSSIDWKPLTSMAQLDAIVQLSATKPVAIFKHSTRCGISRMALSRLEKEFDQEGTNVTMFFLDLLSYRDISNEIAHRFKVYHESPQLIVIQNGKAVYHASHSHISAKDLVVY